MKKRIISILLTACMLVCLIPTGAFAADSTNTQYPAIYLDTKPISNPTKVQNGKNIHFEPNSYVYFGDNGGEPIKWRVLDADKANDGSKNGMFLLSEYLLDNNVKYNYIHGTSEYSDSDGQRWCKDFAANGGHFSELEQEAMLSVEKTDNVEKTLFDYTWDKCSLTDADKMFFPSIREVIDYVGNYDKAPGFIAADTSGNKGTWWLRSHPSGYEKGAGLIYDTGYVDVDNVNTVHSTRPALNLNKNNIAFISAAAGGKSAEGAAGGLVEIPAYSGNEWKLTLYDSSRSDFFVNTKAVSVTTDGGEISISYGLAKNSQNEYISVILFDQDGNAKYYGRSKDSVYLDTSFAQVSHVGGSKKFQIPAGLAEGEYNFVVFSEQYNGDYKTDYIGDLHSVRFTVEKKTEEQFSLATGERYYFDLSSFEIPGTTNEELPDSTLRYVPFIYAGTVNSYVLTTESSMVKGSSEYASKITDPSLSIYGYTYPHSLFIAEHNIKTRVMWYELQRASCIYGVDYQSGGIDYTMRAPTVGSAGNSSDGGLPLRNEWDRILDKNSNFIKNWKNYSSSWGQDVVDSHEGVDYSVCRGGKNSVRNWVDVQKSCYDISCCYRPVLEVKNADELGRNGLRAVTLNFNGTTVGGEEEIKIVVKGGGSFTAPTSDGLERPYGWKYFGWLGDNNRVYAPGDSVPEHVTSLTAQWIEPEEFSLEYGVGNTYYFDLSGEDIPGTVDGDLPDTSLHYVPFTYVGTIEAYKLKSSSIGVVEAAEIASEADDPESMYGYTQLHSLFIADRTLTNRVSWTELDKKGLIFGRDYTSNGINYTMRAPSMGSSYDENWKNLPANNEWDRILAKSSRYIKNMEIKSGKDLFFYWGQDTRINDNGIEYMVLRYEKMIGNRQKDDATDGAYRPVLEVQNAAALGSDGLKEVILYLDGGSLDGKEYIDLLVKNGESFTAPSKEGLVPPSDNLVFAGWVDWESYGTVYQPGDSVPSTVAWLNAKWEKHTHCICGGNAYDGHDSHENVDWKPWTATDSLPGEAGNYFLLNDVTLSGTVILPDGVNICLNGNSIKGEYANGTKLNASGALGITDCSGKGSIGEMTLTGNGAELTLYGGKVAESASLIISGGTAFTMTGKAQNDGFIRILSDADFTMNGEAENNSIIRFEETNSDSRIKFGGHAKGGNVSFESPQYGSVISLDGSAEISSLSGILASIALYVKNDAKIGDVSNITFTGLSLSENAKVGSEDSVFTIECRNVILKDNVQLIGKITYGADRESGALTLQDKASISGELTLSNDGGTETPIKVVMNGDSAVHGNLVCTDEAVSFEMQDNAKIDGNIDAANSVFFGTVTCGGDIISGVFDQEGTVINNGRIVGGIFYGTVMGTGTIEQSAKRTVTFVPNDGMMAANQRTVDILRGQKVGLPTACYRDGYTLAGWNKQDATYDFSTPVLEEITLTAQWTANAYTVKFDANGGSQTADKVVHWEDKVLDGVNAPTRSDGYEFVHWMCGGEIVGADTTYEKLAENDTVESITLTARWRDIEKPAGEIVVKDNIWNKLLNSITFGLFFKETQAVTITASDNSGGNVAIEYLYLTKEHENKEMTEEELEKIGFITYNGPINIIPDNEYVIYAKLIDEAGNTSFICSNGIVLDGTAPVIGGIEDSKTYCQAKRVTITEKYIDTVKVNGTEVTLDTNGGFTLSPAEGEQKIIVTDKAGNTAEMTVTVNSGHTAGQDDGDCTTPIYCIYHSDAVVVEAKQHDFSGEWAKDQSGHWHACRNDGCTVTDTKASHSGDDDGDCTTAVNCEVCGFEIKAAEESHDFSGEWLKDQSGHWHACQNENCTVTETKAAHSGEDDGDCTTAVNCETCGTELKAAEKSHNFSNEWSKDQSDHWHACQNEDCTVTDGKAAHSGEDDGDCTTAVNCETCGAGLKAAEKEHSYGEYVQNEDGSDTHTRSCTNDGCKHTETGKCFGGKATCESRAICEGCGKPYGELDKNNHSHLDRVDGKDPTEDTDGNSDYWHCDGCGKYYDDETATKEISKADTIIEKLPKAQPEGESKSESEQNSDKSGAPKTGDGTSPFMWIALFFISGGICTAVLCKKKRSLKNKA